MEGWIVIDNIENGIASCEINDGKMKLLPLPLLPEGVREGDCLRETGSGYEIDAVETCRRREYNFEMMRRLMKRREDSQEDSPEDSAEE